MIAPEFEAFLEAQDETYLTPAEDVAIFMDTHNADHVMLLLTSNGFSRVPVITKEKVYIGTISIRDIIKYQTAHNLTDWEMTQTDIGVMVDQSIETVSVDAGITEILHKLVDSPFLPVVSKDNTFEGIITRKSILKAVNSLLHTFTKEYTISPNE